MKKFDKIPIRREGCMGAAKRPHDDISYQKLYEPIQNIWFLNYILKQQGCDPYLNHIILSITFTVERTYYLNGRLYALKTLKNSQQHGVEKGWFITGQLWWKTNIKNDKQNGVFKCWYENSQIERENNYQNGELHGLSQYWGDDGQLHSKQIWQNGQRISIHYY